MVGPSILGSFSNLILPCSSAGTFITLLLPKPNNPNDLNNDGCASSPTITLIGGASNNPSDSTSQPAFFSTLYLAAPNAVKFAIVAPVTKAPAQFEGKLKISNKPF